MFATKNAPIGKVMSQVEFFAPLSFPIAALLAGLTALSCAQLPAGNPPSADAAG